MRRVQSYRLVYQGLLFGIRLILNVRSVVRVELNSAGLRIIVIWRIRTTPAATAVLWSTCACCRFNGTNRSLDLWWLRRPCQFSNRYLSSPLCEFPTIRCNLQPFLRLLGTLGPWWCFGLSLISHRRCCSAYCLILFPFPVPLPLATESSVILK